ncbi:beta-xylosidase/alpha-l-arabinosidase [Catenuloplanes atrovinosus]|uniref:Beta-xylosidase n=1 Tax=Catenuloplanes atrovinosus TaxID=137266 RepID=A0AAE3YVG7_9ACTN|nr:glycoside hydrolase family 3 N-terminal domain-containing protein [Catenuloplanes atrovinosus]MDR7280643.1 beta-xylosidase [Catenuloplanes atrovinosus]
MTERGELAGPPTAVAEPWRDPSRPVGERVAALLAAMTLEEKTAQLCSVWMGATATDGDMAPHQHELLDEPDWPQLIRNGLGQITRPFGTAPIGPADGAAALAALQAEIVAASRLGIPAVAHEECLTGFLTWQATVYPTPLAWGAAFDPELVETMAGQIGGAMRAVGVHQGLAPVVDVARDLRWGRVEETIGEDPYLVGTIGAAYVRGLESTGVVATLKHFVGYSASRAGRNFGPVSVGPREIADVLLPPFEMALRDGGARSVMAAYVELDGVPVTADAAVLTTLLRDELGFTGTVVSDYFGLAHLRMLHRVADGDAEVAALALTAGIDTELPGIRNYGPPLVEAVRSGLVPESLVDRAVTRVLTQKCELGLLDPDWKPAPPPGTPDLDPPEARALARRLAEESIVLCANDGVLPLAPDARIALCGPLADDAAGMLGCYTFPRHVGPHHPGLPLGVVIPTLAEALGRTAIPGCTIDGDEEPDIADAADADVIVAVLGDRSGIFGIGTSGEGCDVPDLRLPGRQGELLERLIATGRPVVLVLLSGRPYALGAYADRLAAIVQGFFPGEEGGPAVADVLTGAVCPSGRLPVSMPVGPGGQPATYLTPTLGHRSDVSTVDPTPLFPFGHGLSYTTFEWTAPESGTVTIAADGEAVASVTVRNTGERAGSEIVQLYLHDPVSQVTQPVRRLIGYARVPLVPGEARTVTFTVPADLTAFTGREGRRIVEPGEIELLIAASSEDVRHTARFTIAGPERALGPDRRMTSTVTITA